MTGKTCVEYTLKLQGSTFTRTRNGVKITPVSEKRNLNRSYWVFLEKEI